MQRRARPLLIDDYLIHRQKYGITSREIDGHWYAVNPFNRPKWYIRLVHAYLVLIGKASVFQFKEDTE